MDILSGGYPLYGYGLADLPVHNFSMRPYLLVVVFLLALNSIGNFWNLVGGQYHLELMFWPWKLGLTLALATLATMVTANMAGGRPVWRLGLLIAALMAIAGGVTYYYHLNEPTDEDQGDEPAITKTSG